MKNNRPFIILTGLVLVVSSVWLLEPLIWQALFVDSELHSDLKDHEIVNIAHRGASGHAPENTLPAIDLALEMGADMIAIDVHVTEDGAIVVLHDEQLDRTTNGTGNVHEMSLAEIQALDAGSWFSPEFAGTQVPTLDEALKHINGRAKCLIEMKSKGNVFYEGFAKLVVDVIEDNNAVDWCILEAYDEHYLDEAHEYDERVQIKQILIGEDNTNVFSYFIRTRNLLNTRQKHKYLSAVNPPFHALSERRIYELHSRRLQVFTFLVNEREDMIKVLNMGVDGVITNYPDRLRDILAEIQQL